MGNSIRVAKQEGEPEIFYTLQGEGRNIGEPSVFYRTSECNLQCVWCDTPYTWNFNGTPYKHEDGIKYSREDQQVLLTVGESVDRITQLEAPHLVVTGGEPMLQQAELIELIRGLKADREDFRVDIETNGTVMPTDEMIDAVDLFTVSPKMANSGNKEKRRYRPNVIQAFADIEHADFKFVVQDDEDIPEILSMIDAHQIPSDRIFLMPEGRTREALERHTQQVAELAKDYQFNFTNRLHIELWGDKRGV